MRIMFICTGNICRSAMAHKLLEKKLKDNNIQNVEVYSCGIYAVDGDYSTYNAEEVMKYYDVDMRSHRATNIKNSKIQEMDLILCATMQHKNIVINIFPNLKEKVYTIKEYVKDNDSESLDINDPWGYDIDVYKKCASQIDMCLEKLVKKLIKL